MDNTKEIVMVFETQTPDRYYTMRFYNPKDGITLSLIHISEPTRPY